MLTWLDWNWCEGVPVRVENVSNEHNICVWPGALDARDERKKESDWREMTERDQSEAELNTNTEKHSHTHCWCVCRQLACNSHLYSWYTGCLGWRNTHSPVVKCLWRMRGENSVRRLKQLKRQLFWSHPYLAISNAVFHECSKVANWLCMKMTS